MVLAVKQNLYLHAACIFNQEYELWYKEATALVFSSPKLHKTRSRLFPAFTVWFAVTAVLWHNLGNKVIQGSRVWKIRAKCGQFVGYRLDPVELWIQVWCRVAETPGLCGTEECHWMRGKRGGMPQMALCTPVPHLAFSGAPPPWSGSQLWPTIKRLTVADVTLADGCFFVV